MKWSRVQDLFHRTNKVTWFTIDRLCILNPGSFKPHQRSQSLPADFLFRSILDPAGLGCPGRPACFGCGCVVDSPVDSVYSKPISQAPLIADLHLCAGTPARMKPLISRSAVCALIICEVMELRCSRLAALTAAAVTLIAQQHQSIT